MLQLRSLTFSGQLLQRGFWLYVCEIETELGHEWLYIGRTGDSSSPNAQSPFIRVGQHLGSNKKSNALRRRLAAVNVDPSTCSSFELMGYGPILPESATMEDHRPLRNTMAALECALRNALHSAGYAVLNEVHCRQSLDPVLWREVLEAFTKPFPKLERPSTEVHDELQAR